MNVLYVFGPNLGALGRRDPERYGSRTLPEVMADVTDRAEGLGHEVEWRQSDHEGEVAAWVREAGGEGYGAVVLNAGALTHYSYALRDAIEAGSAPVIEVHQTNIYAREEWRRHSVISAVSRITIAGAGTHGYLLALEALGAL